MDWNVQVKNKAVQLKLEHERKSAWRYDAVTNTNKSDNPSTELRDKFINVFETLQEVDPTLILTPHKSINCSEGATVKPNSMPNKTTQMRKCLDDAMPNEKGGNVHSQVLIAHNQSHMQRLSMRT